MMIDSMADNKPEFHYVLYYYQGISGFVFADDTTYFMTNAPSPHLLDNKSVIQQTAKKAQGQNLAKQNHQNQTARTPDPNLPDLRLTNSAPNRGLPHQEQHRQ